MSNTNADCQGFNLEYTYLYIPGMTKSGIQTEQKNKSVNYIQAKNTPMETL